MSDLSFFDEKRDVVRATFDCGQWWQTVQELHLRIPLPPNTKSKQIQLTVTPNHLKLLVNGNKILEGTLARTVVADELVWTIEEGCLCVVLANAKHSVSEEMWESLFSDGRYAPNPLTIHEMRKNLDLERFQIENPGFDFSRAQLSKTYDKAPGWSHDRLQEMHDIQNEGENNETS